MKVAGIVVRLIVLATVGSLVALVVASLVAAPGSHAAPLLSETGEPFRLEQNQTWQHATWHRLPVLVLVTSPAKLAGVDALRGHGEATPSLTIPVLNLEVVVFSAKSTHLGCTVVFRPDLPASADIADYDGDGVNDGALFDPCGQSRWDAFHDGRVIAGPPGLKDMPRLRFHFEDGQIIGTGYASKVKGSPY